MRTIHLIAGLGLTLLATACGGSGTAKLQFRNATSNLVLQGENPSHTIKLSPAQAQSLGLLAADSFQMKLIAAYLSEDIDPVNQNNTGMTSMFWLNSECADDIMSCTTDPTSNGGKDEEGNSWRHVVTSFFDFSNIANVNSALNSQGREIDTGTYKYVRLEFCKWQSSTSYPNIKWTYSGASGGAEQSFAQASCGVTAAISPPLEVKNGDSVTITLDYSLAGTINSGSGYSNCAGGFCFSLPTFTPSASK